GRDLPEVLEQARQDVLARLRILAGEMSGATRFDRTVSEYFLFTVVGSIIASEAAATFSLGDGLAAVNGRRRALGPFPANQPPYLGYALLDGGGSAFQLHAARPTDDVHSILLGTDGALELERRAPLGPFWSDDLVFKNADMVRRRLTIAGRRGELADDT